MKKSRVSRDGVNLIILVVISVIVALCFFLSSCRSSDKYVRNRVLQLKGPTGACSGVQIKAPSGMVYILTAYHCTLILDENHSALAIDEQGNEKQVSMIDVDKDHDLMLMSSVNWKSVDIAKKVYLHDHIHTITHGLMHAAYRTDGEVLEEVEAEIESSPILGCDKEEMSIFGPVCVKIWEERMISAKVFPGSSGGPVLNDRGELVGIVSIGSADGQFGGMVPLNYVHDFLKSR